MLAYDAYGNILVKGQLYVTFMDNRHEHVVDALKEINPSSGVYVVWEGHYFTEEGDPTDIGAEDFGSEYAYPVQIPHTMLDCPHCGGVLVYQPNPPWGYGADSYSLHDRDEVCCPECNHQVAVTDYAVVVAQ